MVEINTPVPLSLYVHFPWCARKCPYCDFNSHEVKGNKFPEKQYIEALVRDLEFELPRIWGRSIRSVFLGGGTPSLFSGESINEILSVLRSHLHISPLCEITLEANPGTTDAGRFLDFRKAGVNRLSIGVQSFNDSLLKKLGRIHNSEQAQKAVRHAGQAGFENINIDLMFGLPGQSINDAMEDIKKAVSLNTQHLSWYQLTIEPNTVFYSNPPQLPEDDFIWEMQEKGMELLIRNKFIQYEVSAYARDNSLCSHNTNYWYFGDYLGIGAGAHGKITDSANGNVNRFVRHRIPESYINLAGSPDVIVQEKKLTEADLVFEFMMNAMRLRKGVRTNLFNDRTGLPFSRIESRLQLAADRGLIAYDSEELMPTMTGHRYLNNLLEIFLN